MARYTGPDCKRCRREKTRKLFPKGAKCETAKCPIEKRPYPQGITVALAPRRASTCCRCARSRSARVSMECFEKQFRNYYAEGKPSVWKTGENLLTILESRLDNVVFRAGFGKSRDMARQLVRHGHITVNGKKVDIPSYRVTPNDIVEVRGKSREMTPFVVAHAEAGERTVPAWLEVIPNRMRILVHTLPNRGTDRHAGPRATDRRALLEVTSQARS